MTKRFLLAPLAVVISLTFVGAAASPAMAAGANVCATAPAQIRTASTTADASAAKKALHLVDVGEALCREGARNEANKKFAAAAKALGTDMAALTTVATAQ